MIGDVIGSVVGGWLAALGLDRSGRRRNERTWAEGREVVFDGGCSVNARTVIRPADRSWSPRRLWPGSLTRSGTPGGRPSRPTGSDCSGSALGHAPITKSMPAYWSVAECADGLDRVLIACAPDNMRYIRGAIEGHHPGVQPDVR